MNLRFENQVVIITGGSKGIGLGAAERFAQEGAQVVICARKAEALEQAVQGILAQGGRAEGICVNAGNEAAMVDMFQHVRDSYGRLDVLVNNAYSNSGGMIVNQTLEKFNKNFSVTMAGVFVGTREALKIMSQQGSGTIVNVSSLSAVAASPALSGYCAAKAAVNQFTAAAAIEAAPCNVRVNAIMPGSIDTPGADFAMQGNQQIKDAIASSIPLKRNGTSEEVANAILFLASAESSFITGVALRVDGGKWSQLYTPDIDFTNYRK